MQSLSVSVRPLLLVLLAAPLLGACDDHDHGETSDVNEYFYDCEDPGRPAALDVFATDESLRALLDKESAGAIKTQDEAAAHLTAPDIGLSAATPPTFVIQPPATSAAGAPAPFGVPPARARRSFWRRTWQALAPIGTAHAHCKPVTGDNYLLRLTKEGDSKPAYAVLSSVTSFTPNANVWKAAMNGRAGQKLKLTLIRAGYSGGTITSGPFVPATMTTFTVAP
jgi:hypothetical protein